MKAAASLSFLLLACRAPAPPAAPAAAPPPRAASAVAAAPPPPNVAATAAPPREVDPDRPPSPGAVLVGEVVGPPGWNPNPVLESLKPGMLKCYADARILVPELHGKLTLEVHVNGAGAVTSVEAKGGNANEPGLVGCLGDAFRPGKFPKPAGVAILTVPLVFRH